MKTMQDYSCYCTAEQTQRAYELGAPMETFAEHEAMSQSIYNNYCAYLRQEGDELIFTYIPTTQQMIGWLRKKGISAHATCFSWNSKKGLPKWQVHVLKNGFWEEVNFGCCETYEQAELAAIDATLDYLEKGGVAK